MVLIDTQNPDSKTLIIDLLILAALVSYGAGGLASRLARGLALAAAALFLGFLIGCLCKGLDSLIHLFHEIKPPNYSLVFPFWAKHTGHYITFLYKSKQKKLECKPSRLYYFD